MGIPHVDVLLFVGVAVAWAVYLIPKAMQHHEQAARTRSVERFSHRVRVLARREPVSAREAELVAADAPAPRPALGASPAETRAAAGLIAGQREATRRATRRRRRVLAVLLLAVAAVAGVAAYGLVEWAWVGVPAGLVVAWLVIARITVKRERARLRPRATRSPVEADAEVGNSADEPLATEVTTEIARVVDGEPGMWDPVPVTLPTYVDKPAAARSVRSIDLEADDVWTSGHTQADTALARRADAEAAAARAARDADPGERAAGAAG